MKIFIIDLSVLLYDPAAIFNFNDNKIAIPITVIEEIDKYKKELTESGRNARQVSRFLDKLREKSNLSAGVKLENGGLLWVEILRQTSMGRLLDQLPLTDDNKVLAVALELQQRHPKTPVILVTKNTTLRIKADALGLVAQDYERGKVNIDELYGRFVKLKLEPEELSNFSYRGYYYPKDKRIFYPHSGIILQNKANPSEQELGRYSPERQGIVPLKNFSEGVWGIKPRNQEQCFALDLLLEDQVRLVSLTGISGTGKTLLALASALQKTVKEKLYQRILVARPVFPLGKDIGYLPGAVEEKLSPWMQPIFDNLQLLLSNPDNRIRQRPKGSRDLLKLGMMEIEPLTYIRGRNLPNQFLIVDEAQNLTPHEIKTIVTRAGEGTKIVLTGDTFQIDNPYLDAASNGLAYVVEKFKHQDIAGHVHLVKGERSLLAELAAGIL